MLCSLVCNSLLKHRSWCSLTTEDSWLIDGTQTSVSWLDRIAFCVVDPGHLLTLGSPNTDSSLARISDSTSDESPPSVNVAASILAQYVSFGAAPFGFGDPAPLQYLLSTHLLEHSVDPSHDPLADRNLVPSPVSPSASPPRPQGRQEQKVRVIPHKPTAAIGSKGAGTTTQDCRIRRGESLLSGSGRAVFSIALSRRGPEAIIAARLKC